MGTSWGPKGARLHGVPFISCTCPLKGKLKASEEVISCRSWRQSPDLNSGVPVTRRGFVQKGHVTAVQGNGAEPDSQRACDLPEHRA